MPGYTDLTTEFAYKDVASWKNYDSLAESDALHYSFGNMFSFGAYNNATQSFSSASPAAIAIFNTELFDAEGIWNAASSKMVPTKAGKYIVMAGIEMDGGADGSVYAMDLFTSSGGGTILKSGTIMDVGNAGLDVALNLVCIFNVTNLSDEFTVRVTVDGTQVSTGGLEYSWVMGGKLPF